MGDLSATSEEEGEVLMGTERAVQFRWGWRSRLSLWLQLQDQSIRGPTAV